MPIIRPLAEPDLPQAARILRTAFGTFLGAPDLETFWADLDYVHGRFGAENVESFAAEEDGVLLGSNFAVRWGSFGFFGPLSILPERWNGGCAQPLVGAVCDAFARWQVTHSGLVTFAHSAKHVHLYGKFGFYPRFLTAIMAAPAKAGTLPERARYSTLAPPDRKAAEDASYALTDAIYDGLDLRGEIRTVGARNLGDTLLLWEGSRLAGFAICHRGAGTEAGADSLFIKFGAVRPGPDAEKRFGALLDTAGALAVAVGMKTVIAGINLAREEAYRQMKASGFRTEVQAVAMHRGNEAGYNRPGVYALDDWR
jgi:acetyltransferase (GNAT) family protein